MYEIDQKTGLLEKKFNLPISGDYPKDLVIFPDNQHIAIANHASNTITVFRVCLLYTSRNLNLLSMYLKDLLTT